MSFILDKSKKRSHISFPPSGGTRRGNSKSLKGNRDQMLYFLKDIFIPYLTAEPFLKLKQKRTGVNFDMFDAFN
jgi:hypothetical protein